MPESSGGAEAEPAAAMRARVRASFERQVMMTTLGAELVSVERGRVELAIPYDARFAQQHGFLHAGVPATAGEAAPFAVMQATLTARYDRPGIRH